MFVWNKYVVMALVFLLILSFMSETVKKAEYEHICFPLLLLFTAEKTVVIGFYTVLLYLVAVT